MPSSVRVGVAAQHGQDPVVLELGEVVLAHDLGRHRPLAGERSGLRAG